MIITRELFKKFNEVNRHYKASTPILEYNNKKKEIGYVIVATINESLSDYIISKFTDRTMVDIDYKSLIVNTKTLLPYKRIHKEGNYIENNYDIFCIGNKRPSTNLSEGLIFQLQYLEK